MAACPQRNWNSGSETEFGFFLLSSTFQTCSVQGFRPHGLLVYRLCLPPDTPIIINGNLAK